MNEGPIEAEERAGPLGSRHREGVGAWGRQGRAQGPPLPSLSQESTAEVWTDIRVRADPGSVGLEAHTVSAPSKKQTENIQPRVQSSEDPAGAGCAIQVSFTSWRIPYPSIFLHSLKSYSSKTVSLTSHPVTLWTVTPRPCLPLPHGPQPSPAILP